MTPSVLTPSPQIQTPKNHSPLRRRTKPQLSNRSHNRSSHKTQKSRYLVTSAGFTENFDAMNYLFDRMQRLWGVD